MNTELKLFVDGIVFQKHAHGGIARIFREILPRMCEIDRDLHVTLFVDGPLNQEPPSHHRIVLSRAPAFRRPIRVKGVWKYFLYPFRRVGSKTWNYIRSLWLGRGQNTIWHSTYYTYPIVWDGFQVVTVYDLIHERYSQMFNDPLDNIARRQKQLCVEKADAVICISDTTRQDVERFYNKSNGNLFVIPISFSEVFRYLCTSDLAPLDIPKQSYFLYVGMRSFNKNFYGLLDVYNAWDHRNDVSLVVVGPQWSDDEKRYIKNLALSERVHLMTEVDDETLCQLYNQALALVFPSIYEGFGLPLLEAMSCGCPVIASNIPSSIEVAGECPIYFDYLQPASLLIAFDEVFLEGRNSARTKRGLEWVKRFSWDRTALQTLEVYRSMKNVNSIIQ